MVIYENIKVIESTIEVYGNMQVTKDHTIVWFHASHTQYHHSMTIVWESMHEFYQIMITYSSEQKNDLKYSWKTVAAHLRDLWTNALWAEGHTRLVVNEIKNSRLKILYTYITLFSLFGYKWYVGVTYQPHAHICTSGKRYVADTYRCIIVTPCKKHVSYTCNSGELIQIGTEQLRNKRIFIYFPYGILLLLLGALFITNLAN